MHFNILLELYNSDLLVTLTFNNYIIGVSLVYSKIAEMDNLLGKITDLITIMVRVVRLMVRCF